MLKLTHYDYTYLQPRSGCIKLTVPWCGLITMGRTLHYGTEDFGRLHSPSYGPSPVRSNGNVRDLKDGSN